MNNDAQSNKNTIEKIKSAISANKLDALLIIDPINRFYATGFQSSAGMLLVTQDDAWFYTDSRYIELAETTISNVIVQKVTDDSSYRDLISSILKDKGISSIGFEDGSVTYSEYKNLEDKLEVTLVPAQKILSDLRAIKSADDLEKMKKAQLIAEKSFEEIVPLISVDMTEKELSAELLYRFLKNGADDKSFDTIAVSGPKSSMPHGVPDNIKISRGFLTIDFGVRLGGWCSDTTRTLCIGDPTAEMVKVYDTVLSAQLAGIDAVRSGVSGRDVDMRAREVIEDAGYGEFFGHGFGHGLGLEVHESPRASKTSEDILNAGVVISAEPGIYLPGRFGVRIEDVLFVTDTGSINITNLRKDLIVI